MNSLILVFVALAVVAEPVAAQTEDFARQHTLLTTDCKSIRGHAKRIVEEASERELNTSVAMAHLSEVVKSLTSMEKLLEGTKKLLSAAQLKLVAAEYAALEKTCGKLKNLSDSLEKEMAKAKPDKFLVRELALDLRNEMATGSKIHDQMTGKLGLK